MFLICLQCEVPSPKYAISKILHKFWFLQWSSSKNRFIKKSTSTFSFLYNFSFLYLSNMYQIISKNCDQINLRIMYWNSTFYYFSSLDKSKIKKKSRTNVEVTEVDPGHRHWSAVHWMYPGLFHPIGTKTHKKKEKQIKTQTYGQNKSINKVIYLIIYWLYYNNNW